MNYLNASVTVVIPTFNSSLWIVNTVNDLARELYGQIHELLIVDDGSEDDTWNHLTDLSSRLPVIRAFRLRENVGQRKATLIGVMMAKGDYCITVDDDGKNSIEQIRIMGNQLIEDKHKFIYGKPSNSPNGAFRANLGKLFRSLVSATAKNLQWKHQSSFRGFSHREFIAHNDKIFDDDSLDGLLFSTFGSPHVIYLEENLSQTKSRYSFKKLLKHGLGQLASTRKQRKTNQPIDIESLIIDRA